MLSEWHSTSDFRFLHKMTSEKLNAPESVADFVQGTHIKAMGATHYMRLKRKAIQSYLCCTEHLRKLSRKLSYLQHNFVFLSKTNKLLFTADPTDFNQFRNLLHTLKRSPSALSKSFFTKKLNLSAGSNLGEVNAQS